MDKVQPILNYWWQWAWGSNVFGNDPYWRLLRYVGTAAGTTLGYAASESFGLVFVGLLGCTIMMYGTCFLMDHYNDDTPLLLITPTVMLGVTSITLAVSSIMFGGIKLFFWALPLLL